MNNVIDSVVNRSTDWDACVRFKKLKEVVVKECQNISKERASAASNDIELLYEQIEKANTRLLHATSQHETEVIEEDITQRKSELQKYLSYKAEGAQICSKTVWYQKAERNTKYFFCLEKIKYNNKTLNAVLCEDGTISKDERRILQEQTKFYRKLYSKDPNVLFKLTNVYEVYHTADTESKLKQEFSYEELTKALSQMARGKSPGNDGLTSSFYIVFWNKIGRILWNAVQQSFVNGYIYKSARRGVISLIPKTGKNSLLVASYRPITLLNCCHKIVTKMITNRLKPHLTEVINTQQTGYVPGRFIGINLRRLIDLIQYIELTEQSMVLINVDFEKCFDSISH